MVSATDLETREQRQMHFVECCILQMRMSLKGIKRNKRIVAEIDAHGRDAEKMLHIMCPALGEWEDICKEK